MLPRRYLRTVLRDNPVRLDISRIDLRSRKYQRLITLNKATSITPFLLLRRRCRRGLYVGHFYMQIYGFSGSILDAN